MELVRFQDPEVPPLSAIAPYYAASEAAGFYSNGGPCAELLAGRLAAYLGAAHVQPVANCTLGLMAALRALAGEPTATRSLVAVPSFTFTASACAIVWAGFEPLFVDVLPDSWQMDPAALRDQLDRHERRVAAVMGCSTFGSAPPDDVRAGWRDACAAAGVPLLVDSAAGFGAVDERGRRIGGLGDTEVFSFHATKPFAVGEGGAIATPDPEVAERIERLINFGMERGGRSSAVAGLNAKCSELHAATALAMLDRFDDALARRRASAARVRSAILRGGGAVALQRGSEGSTFQICQVVTDSPMTRMRALAAARELGVQARSYFDPPLHRQPAFSRWAPRGGLPVTESLAARSLSLPMANDLSADAVERIAAVTAAAPALAEAA
ncbi:MAG TPA: DegT/DnrJ/EryC1/StrS family aminotransferase [Capillimicrobium sp.]|nr:DegT/DnrJ/EryC1/StrS family aminotransferase [Capillimicrobium sp.]